MLLGFRGVVIGIGDEENDYEAYDRNRVFSIMVELARDARALRGGVMVPDWRYVHRLFELNPSLRRADQLADLWRDSGKLRLTADPEQAR